MSNNKNKQLPFHVLLAKKKRYIAHNSRLVAMGKKPRPLPMVFRSLGKKQLAPNVRGPRPKPGFARPRRTKKKNNGPLPPHLDQSVKEIEKKTGKPVVVVSVAQPNENAYEWDQTGLQLLIEIMAADLSLNTDLFLSITPLDFAYHCVYMVYTYMQRFGGLTGVSTIPNNADTSNAPVPIALAKYMEYLAPYNGKGIKVSTCISLTSANAFFSTTVTSTSLGLLAGVYATRPKWFPTWTICPAETGSNLNHTAFALTATGIQSFSTFLANAQYRGKVSRSIQSAVKTVELRKIAVRAPDSSAYARLTVPYNAAGTSDPLSGAIRGLDQNYDPEVTILLSPQAPNGVNYTNLYAKPYPVPTIRRTTPLFTDNAQIASVLHFLGNNGTYVPGKIKNSLPFRTKDNSHYLRTLFPQEQPVDGIGLSNMVNQAHAALITAQNAGDQTPLDSTPDSANVILTLQAMLAFSVAQKRMNQGEVLHWNTPPCANVDLVDITFPQLFYMDSALTNVEFSLMLSAAITAIGPVVVDGVLRVPASDYDNILTHAEGVIVGPYDWAAHGFFVEYDSTYPRHTTFSTAWGTMNNATPTKTPEIIIDNTTVPPTALTTTWVSDNYGAQPVYANPQIIHPALPTGSAATAILNQYIFELQKGQFGQSIVTCPIGARVDGDYAVMTSTITRDAEDFTTASTQPFGFAPGDSDNNTVIASGSISKMVSPSHLQPEDASLVALTGIGDVDGMDTTTPTNAGAFIRMKAFKFQAPGAIYEQVNRDITGPYSTDIPWGAGTAGLMNQLCRALMIPSSKVADAIHKDKSSQGFDPIALFKQQAGPILERSMRGAPITNVPIRKYVSENDAYARPRQEKKSFLSKVSDAAGTAVKVTESAVKGASKIAELSALFL